MGRRLRGWILRMVLGCVLGVAGVVAAVLWRLAEGPIPLRILDRPIADAIVGLAPDVTVRVGTTALVRAGRGVALEVGGIELLAPDGTPTLSLAHVRVRPSFGALLRGRVVIARVDVDDAVLPLVRRADGEWALGGDGAETVLTLGDADAAAAAPTSVPLPRIALARCRIGIDDRRSGLTVALSEVDLVVSPRRGAFDAALTAVLDLASASPPIRGRVRTPFRAELGADLAADGDLEEVRFAVAAERGELAPADDAGAPLPLAGVEATGRWYPGRETVEVGRLVADIGGSHLDARARVVLAAPPVVGLEGTVDALPLSRLARLWPIDLATEARGWVAASLREGELRRCRVRLGPPAPADETGPPPPAYAAAAPPEPQAVDVACDFRGVAADYLPPLDPIRNAVGSARLTADRLSVEVESGSVGACRVDGGTFVLAFDVEPPRAAIGADVSGATADVLAIVEKPPIAFTPPLGITRATVGGTARVHADLHLPITAKLGPNDVRVRATAALADASLPPLAAGIGIHGGQLDVRVDGTTRVAIRGTTDVTGTPLVAKPVTLALDVAPGAKPAERAVTLTLDGAEVAARGSARVAGDALAAVTVDHLRLAGSDVTATVQRAPDGAVDAAISGASLDLERLFGHELVVGRDAGGFTAPFTLALDVAHLRTGQGLELAKVRGRIAGRNGSVTAVDMGAGIVPDGSLTVRLEEGNGPRQVSVKSDRAGRVLAAVAGLQQFVGGSLSLSAVTDARGPLAALDGKLVLRDVRIVHAPVLAKVLALGSLKGIASLVQGEGLPIAKARFPFRWDGTRLVVKDVRAVGAVGLTADGSFDVPGGTCDVRGNVIPAYSLNSALGKVPLLGRFLVGAKGDGVFGIDYRVRGKTADPTVSVNPLTSVAPTVLRAWFVDPFTRGGDDEDGAPPPR